MAPIRGAVASAPGLAIEVDNTTPEGPHVTSFSTDSNQDTLPDTLISAVCSPNSAVALGTIEEMHDKLITEQLRPVAGYLENDGDIDEGAAFEHTQSTTRVDGEKCELAAVDSSNNHTARQLNGFCTAEVYPLVLTTKKDLNNRKSSVSQTQANSDHDTVINSGSCTLLPEERPSAEDPPTTKHKYSGTPEENKSQEKDDQLATTDGMQTRSGAGHDETGGDTEGESFADDEDTVIETPKQSDSTSEQSRSLPPHMRSTFKAPNSQPTSSLQSRRDWPAQVLPAPGACRPENANEPARPPLDYDELQRTKAQLMKAHNDLEVERKANAEMEKTVGAKKQASIGAAMSDMLGDLLQKQAEALTAKAKAEEKERELQYREQNIKNLEIYLAEGQKQLKYQLEQQGIRSMSVVDEANLRREVELKIKHQLYDIEGKIRIQVERLRHQEAVQKIREQQYRALSSESLENEIREQHVRGMQARTAGSKAAETAHKCCIAGGERLTGARALDNTLKQEFLKGYAACYRSQTALYNMRQGRLAADSPELAFLYDPTHAENLHNIGLSVGHMEAEAEKAASGTVGKVINRKSVEEGGLHAVASTDELQSSSNAVTLHGRRQAHFNNTNPHHASQVADRSEQVPSAQLDQTQQQEEKIRSPAPPHATFASELRRTVMSAVPNGVFASKSNASAAQNGIRATAVPITNSVHSPSMAGRVGEGVYARRRIVRYKEDSDVEPASPNLIDLY